MLEKNPLSTGDATSRLSETPSSFDFIAVRAVLRALYPAIAANVPLALGTRQRLAAEMEEHGFSMRTLRRFMKPHILSNAYIKKLATDGAFRYTLDMDPAEPVSDEDRESAMRTVLLRLRGHAERARAAKPPEPPPEPPPIVVPSPGRPILRLKPKAGPVLAVTLTRRVKP